jgi:hypothetical protein
MRSTGGRHPGLDRRRPRRRDGDPAQPARQQLRHRPSSSARGPPTPSCSATTSRW